MTSRSAAMTVRVDSSFHQLSVVDLTGRIVQHCQQIVPAFILKPLVLAGVNMQHHALQGPQRSALSMHPPPRTKDLLCW